MRTPDPQWQELAREPFARWLTESDLKYHAPRVRALIARRAELPLEGPIELEVGSNRGRFIKGLCAARRDVRFVGIELKRSLCGVARRRLERHGLENGQIFSADARLAVPIFFDEGRLQAAYVLFPDPWWKKRHAKRRLLNVDFIGLLHSRLRDGGSLVIRTDVAFYAEHVSRLLDAMGAMFDRIGPESVEGADRWSKTTRERHVERDGLAVHDLLLRKRAGSDGERAAAMAAAEAVEAAIREEASETDSVTLKAEHVGGASPPADRDAE